jgi:phospholipase C
MRIALLVCFLVLSSAARRQDDEPRIKHVVVLMMENRPFDHLFGWYQGGVDGLTGEEFNLVDPANPSSDKVYADNKAPFMNQCDPCHATPCTTSKLFSTDAVLASGVPDNGGFVAYQNSSAAQNYCNVMSGFPPEKVPILTALAQEYAIMDRFFASHPGPTWPNRMFALTGTSAGSTETSCWYHAIPGKLYPQKTIYDQVEEAGLQWRNYFNDTPWELILEKVAHSPHNLHPLDQFYRDAESGDLPAFSWLNPRSGMNITTGVGSNDQHPDHDMSAGEQYYKDVYEALRASPAWEETLFVITYDEHGGFYDHVIPPTQGIPPPGDGEKSYVLCCYTIVLPSFLFFVSLSLIHLSIAACLHSLTLSDTSLTIIPLAQSSINRHNTHITYYLTGTPTQAFSSIASASECPPYSSLPGSRRERF